MNELDSIVKEFLVESYENLDRLDRDLVALEKEPRDSKRLSSIFRTIHTIKGTCRFFGFSTLESVTHVGENLLSRLRDGILILDPERTSALLALLDAVREMLACIEKSGNDGNGDYQALIDRLTLLQDPSAQKNPSPTQPVKEDKAPTTIGEKLIQEGKVKPKQVLEAIQQQIQGDPLRLGEILVEKGIVQVQDVRDAVNALQESKGGAIAETNIRVDVGLLDKLMNLVGELVLARNQILQFNLMLKDTTFLSTTQRLNLITTELQEGVMKTRMQPIGNVWNRFPRVVRDLSIQCGKRVRVEMEGKETELDKTIIEAIKDPLTHVVRNSVDHGIETPEIRQASGKLEEGRLTLRAFHEGGQVIIEIADDGAGIDAARVKSKALERGLISKNQADRMSDREAIQLIFLPGFSTAAKVTNVSGRGVGMDVVKTNIEKIGGHVDIQTFPGRGTTLKIKIPLTLAIIPALVVSNGKGRFAIPQVSLLELVRLEGDGAHKHIEMIHGTPVYRLRGSLLPLVYLDRELKAAPASPHLENDAVNIVVLQADDRRFGLVVERINDTEEIVVKPLSKQLKGISVFAGATIMGDGKIALILDVLGIAQRAGVVSEVRDRSTSDSSKQAKTSIEQRETLLIVGLGRTRRLAIPLTQVARLEEISTSSVEETNDQKVVQYRGQILPLINLDKIIGRKTKKKKQLANPLQVVVYTENGRSVGLVVDRILDIIETEVKVQQTKKRAGLKGAAVIAQKVTDLIDVHGVIQTAVPDFYSETIRC